MGDRCGGHCCERFVLPFGPAEMWSSYMQVNGQQVFDPPVPNWVDIKTAAPAFVYLGLKMFVPETGQPCEPVHHYTCRLFNRERKECTIYERRPLCCRTYPSHGPCTYKGCTWDCSSDSWREHAKSHGPDKEPT